MTIKSKNAITRGKSENIKTNEEQSIESIENDNWSEKEGEYKRNVFQIQSLHLLYVPCTTSSVPNDLFWNIIWQSFHMTSYCDK